MLPLEKMPKNFEECIDRMKKACEYLCSEGLYPEGSFYVNPPASNEDIASAEKLLGFKLPRYYGECLKIANGYKFITAEFYGTSRFGQNDNKTPGKHFAVGWKNRGTAGLSLSPFDGELYESFLRPEGSITKQITLIMNEMYDLLEQLEKEVDKHKRQKIQDAKSPEQRQKEIDTVIARLDKISENCPVDTSKKPESIRECVERLRKANDLLVNEYGYDSYAAFGPPAKEEEIIKYEKQLGFTLPREYREFIKLTGTISFSRGDERIYGFEDIGANDVYTPDGYLALSYVSFTSERLAMSQEDGELYLFWDLDGHPDTFLNYLERQVESWEETVSEEYEREEKEKMRADGITQEDESEALHAMIQAKYARLIAEKEKKNTSE